jgi:hypothetical protein
MRLIRGDTLQDCIPLRLLYSVLRLDLLQNCQSFPAHATWLILPACITLAKGTNFLAGDPALLGHLYIALVEPTGV